MLVLETIRYVKKNTLEFSHVFFSYYCEFLISHISHFVIVCLFVLWTMVEKNIYIVHPNPYAPHHPIGMDPKRWAAALFA